MFLDGYKFVEKIFAEYGFDFEKAVLEKVSGLFGIKEKIKSDPTINLKINDIPKLQKMVEELLIVNKYKDEIIVLDDLFLILKPKEESYEITLFHNTWGGGIKGVDYEVLLSALRKTFPQLKLEGNEVVIFNKRVYRLPPIDIHSKREMKKLVEKME